VAEHHDGWSNWDSTINPYNAAAMGPERDLTGELADATRERDLKFITSFHHAPVAEYLHAPPEAGISEEV
jgi:alpha-L-fucosidase